MSRDHVVVWDGRRNGPGGALLFAPEGQKSEHVTPTRKVSVPHGAITERALRARDAFGEQWFEPWELAEVAAITGPQAHTCLANLVDRGLVARQKSRRGAPGRPRYRWVVR